MKLLSRFVIHDTSRLDQVIAWLEYQVEELKKNKKEYSKRYTARLHYNG